MSAVFSWIRPSPKLYDNVAPEIGSLLRMAWPFIAIFATLLTCVSVSLAILGAMRAYVHGESMWSKGQKNATYCLARYVREGSAEALSCYEHAIAIPMGDRQARIELQKAEPDYGIARAGFLVGGNDPEDVSSMIGLFRVFSGIGPIRNAISIWSQADTEIDQLDALAHRLQVIWSHSGHREHDLERLAAELDQTQARLTPLENSFSATISKASREFQNLLWGVVAAITVILAYLALWLMRKRQFEQARHLHALHASEKRYEALFETSQDAILIVQADGMIIDANPAACEMFRFSKAQLRQLGSAAIAGNHSFRHNLALASANTPFPLRGVIEYQRSDASPILCDVSTTLISNDAPLVCASVFIRDISERETQRKRLMQLAALHAALSEFSQLTNHIDRSEPLFQELCRICADRAGLSIASVAIKEPSLGEVRLASESGDRRLLTAENSNQRQQRIAIARELATEAIRRNGHVVRVNQRTRSLAHEETWERIPAWAAFPIYDQGNPIGAIVFGSVDPGFVEPNIIELLRQLSRQTSVAIERFTLQKERVRYNALMSGQNEILRLLANGADIERILTALVGFAEHQLVRGRACALLCNEQATHFTWVTANRLDAALREHLLGMPIQPGQDPASDAIVSRRPAFAGNMSLYQDASAGRQRADIFSIQACHAWPIIGRNGQPLGAFAVFYEETGSIEEPSRDSIQICLDLAGIAIESRHDEDRIWRLAHYDELTGLPNRFLYRQKLGEAIERARHTGELIAILFIDLDRFKNINDTFGHQAGDRALQVVGQRLQKVLGESDLLARVGGDEFFMLLEGHQCLEQISTTSERLLAAANTSITVDGHDCLLSASIGISIFPRDGDNVEVLQKNADIAMYRAKAAGRDNVRFYSADMNTQGIERLAFEAALRRAIEQREFVVHYQPHIALSTGKIVGVEALVRWLHPERGLLSPGEFIDVAEEAGLIQQIGKLVLECACLDAMQWLHLGLPAIRVSVNLSVRQFDSPSLLSDLDETLLQTKFDPHYLELEITESLMMSDPDHALAVLEQVRARGIQIAVDDFGTGYSSLAYLKRFPVNTLKIDRTFVRDIPGDPNDVAIVRAIIAMGQSLGLHVIAEGVETQAQLDVLQAFGCEQAQGFYFHRPLPADQLRDALAAAYWDARRTQALHA